MKSKEDIIKSLNSYVNGNCHSCVYYNNSYDCCDELHKDIVTLIKQMEDNHSDDVWNFVREIFKIDTQNLDKIFGYCYSKSVINNLSYNEAKEKFEEWKEQRTIHIDDVVFVDSISDASCKYVCTKDNVNGDYSRCHLMKDDGSGWECEKSRCKKTGEHIEISSILEQFTEKLK